MTKKNTKKIHPGEILKKEYMKPLGLSANKLALEIGVPTTRIGAILKQERSITPDTALRLAKYFNTDAQTWLSLQTTYDLKVIVEKDNLNNLNKLSNIDKPKSKRVTFWLNGDDQQLLESLKKIKIAKHLRSVSATEIVREGLELLANSKEYK